MADYQAFCCLYEIFTNHLIFHPPLNKNSTPATTLYHRNAIFFFHHVTAPNHKNWYKSGIKILSQTPETLDFPEFFPKSNLLPWHMHRLYLPKNERTCASRFSLSVLADVFLVASLVEDLASVFFTASSFAIFCISKRI